MNEKTTVLGIVSPIPKDEWQSGIVYQRLSIVTHNKNTYIAKQNSNSIEPNVSTNWNNYWMQLSPKLNDITEYFDEELQNAINNYQEQLNQQVTEFLNQNTVQIIENKNKITALYNLSISKNLLVYDNAELTQETQETGGSDLIGLTILDNSYAIVNKISGNTVASKNLFDISKAEPESSSTIINIANNSVEFNASSLYIPLIAGQRYILSFKRNKNANIYLRNGKTGSGYFVIIGSADTSVVVSVLYTGDGINYLTMSTFANGLILSDIQIEIVETGNTATPYTPYFSGLKNAQILGIKSATPTDYEPYQESTMTLPQTVELGKWDYIENGKVVRQTITENYDSSKYDSTTNTYNGTSDFVLSNDGLTIAYKSSTQTNTPISFDNKYLVWNNGTETVQTPTDESGYTCFDYGANSVEENSYYVIVGDNV